MSAAAHNYRAAVIYLHGRGAHFVLCRGKKPVWGKWQRRRPCLDLCLTHGPQLGLIPFSIGTSALDIDYGEIGELIEAAPPLVTLRTQRGYHSFYKDDTPRGNEKFTLYGCRGEVRSARGYLRLYEGGAAKLANALRNPPANASVFPADLFEVAEIEAPRTLPVQVPRRFNVDIPTDLPPLETVLEGSRNNALFDHLRFWAYAQDKGRHPEAWHPRVRRIALQYNAAFPDPLPVREVEATAYSVSTWTSAGGGPIDHSPTAQRRRNVKSIQARRKARQPLVEIAKWMRSRGASIPEIMAATATSRATVFRWLALPESHLPNQCGGEENDLFCLE